MIMRFYAITCAILSRECHFCAALSRNLITLKICEKGLHDLGAEKMTQRLQAEINACDEKKYDAILLIYGLCNNGTAGLRSGLPIVQPRAHDCITLLLGSREKYTEVFNENPGTYYLSPGWIEHNDSCLDNPDSTVSQMGMATFQEYVEKYGEENARYLMETLDMTAHYTRLAYIDTRVGDSGTFKRMAGEQAKEKGLEYGEMNGDTGLILRMMDGAWDDREFLVLEPGKAMKPSNDENIIRKDGQT